MAARRDNSTAYFVFIIIALALIAIGYLVFTAEMDGLSPTVEERTWLADCMKYSHTESCYDRLRTMREWE